MVNCSQCKTVLPLDKTGIFPAFERNHMLLCLCYEEIFMFPVLSRGETITSISYLKRYLFKL